MRYFFAAVLVLLLTACTTSRGFDRGALRGQISEQKQDTGEELQKAPGLKPQLPSPFRLAVYFTPPSAGGSFEKSWSWLAADRAALLAIGTELKSKGIISDAIEISNHNVEGNGTETIRLAAARAGADTVLIVNGVCDVDRYNNNLAYSYFLLITTLIIPGNDADAIFMAHASLWDVRSRHLYVSAEGEGTAKDIKPVVFIDEKRIIKAAKSAALTSLKKDLSSRLAEIGAK